MESDKILADVINEISGDVNAKALEENKAESKEAKTVGDNKETAL